MGGPDDVSQYAHNGRWVLNGSLSLASPGFGTPQIGPSLELTRHIPFGAKTVALSQMSMDNYWSLDLGAGGRTGGWAGGRPQFFAAMARAGINYNLFNRIGAGLTFRGGYADVAREGGDAANGVAWSGGLRMNVIVTSLAFFSEVGVLSLPSATGEGRDNGPYGMVGGGWMF